MTKDVSSYFLKTYVRIDFHNNQDCIHNNKHHYSEHIGHCYHMDYLHMDLLNMFFFVHIDR